MRVVRVDHVQLAMPAEREADAIAFYEGLLGIPNVAKPPHLAARGGCWFERGDLRVHLGVEPSFVPAKKAHPGLAVDDLAALCAALEAAGCAVDPDPHDPDGSAYVHDPFGNRIELLQDRAGSS